MDLDNDGILNTVESQGDYQLDIANPNNPLIVKTATNTIAGAYTVSIVAASDSSIDQTAIGELTSSLDSGGKQNTIEWDFNDQVNFKLMVHLDFQLIQYVPAKFFYIFFFFLII